MCSNTVNVGLATQIQMNANVAVSRQLLAKTFAIPPLTQCCLRSLFDYTQVAQRKSINTAILLRLLHQFAGVLGVSCDKGMCDRGHSEVPGPAQDGLLCVCMRACLWFNSDRWAAQHGRFQAHSTPHDGSTQIKFLCLRIQTHITCMLCVV